jgi:hypothetical protein
MRITSQLEFAEQWRQAAVAKGFEEVRADE